MIGGLHDYIFRLDRVTLTAFAFTCEKYNTEKLGGKNIRGGLHDRIRSMSDAEIIDYILNKTKTYPELDSYNKLQELSVSYGFVKQPENFLEGVDGGLHDFIWRESRDVLIRWALTTEKHHNFTKGIKILGGLEDYVNTMTNEQLVDYILAKAKEHPELNNAQALDKFSVEYGFSQ